MEWVFSFLLPCKKASEVQERSAFGRDYSIPSGKGPPLMREGFKGCGRNSNSALDISHAYNACVYIDFTDFTALLQLISRSKNHCKVI